MKTKKSFKRMISFILSAVLIIAASGVYINAAEMDDLQNQQEEIQKKIESYQKEIDKLSGNKAEQEKHLRAVRGKVEAEQQSIDILSRKIDSVDREISSLSAEIEQINSKIIETEKKSEETTVRINDTKVKLEERIKANYKTGAVSNLEILLTAKDFSSFLTRLEIVTRIAKKDKEIIDTLQNDIKELIALKAELEEKKSEMEVKKTALDSKRNQLSSEMAVYQSKQDELSGSMRELTSIVNSLSKESSEVQSLKAKQEEALRAVEAEMERIARSGSNSNDGSVAPSSGYRWPLDVNGYISSLFGPARVHPVFGYIRPHNGVDISASAAFNRPIYAVQSGTVITASRGYNGGWGNYVMIDHGGGIKTLYAHCETLNVGVGQNVAKGDVIARVGSTGASTGPHLHLEFYLNGTRVDPLRYIDIPSGTYYDL